MTVNFPLHVEGDVDIAGAGAGAGTDTGAGAGAGVELIVRGERLECCRRHEGWYKIVVNFASIQQSVVLPSSTERTQ